MFTRTLAQFKTRVAPLADIVGKIGSGSGERYQTSIVDAIADETYMRLRGEVTRRGFREFRERTTRAALPTTPVSADSSEQYATVAYPTGAIALLGLDVLQNGRWRRLKKLDGWSERRDHQDVEPNDSRRPYAWDVLSHGSVATTVFTPGAVAIFPVPTAGDYVFWYLPDWTRIAGNDTYLFLYREQCWYDYHVAEAVKEICGLWDNDSARRYAAADEMCKAALTAIGEFTAIETSDGPTTWTRDERYHG